MFLANWAQRWNIPETAMKELAVLFGVDYSLAPRNEKGISEAAIQQRIRLDASRYGVRLWRNNNGATLDENGRMIRFGLANDSAKINGQMKSSDLIGVTPILVLPEHVGRTFGLFTSIEVKRPGWRYTGTKREKSQFNWITLISSMGGIAKFANTEDGWRI